MPQTGPILTANRHFCSGALINTDARNLVWLLDCLADLGLDADAIATRSGVTPEQLLEPDNPISEQQYRSVLRDALQCSGDTGLGLKLGLKRSIATLDQFAYMLMSSESLRSSSERGLRYQNYSGRFSGKAVITSFSELAGEGCYQVHAKDDLNELRLLAIEDILASTINTCHWVLGRRLPLTRLQCDYPAPPHAADYEAIFACPVQFERPATRLCFDAHILDQPLPQASPQSVELYERLCRQKSIERSQGDTAARVWELIVRRADEPPALGEVAFALHCSERTLRRKLLAEGWQYQHLVDQVREVHARRYLSDATRSITEIAHALGYGDSSSFHRAFKKWTGYSPSDYRKRLLA